MRPDPNIYDLDFIQPRTRRKLDALAIHTLSQLAARLRPEAQEFQRYLGLDDQDFEALQSETIGLLQQIAPEQTLPHIFPRKSTKGVSLDLLTDSHRPRFNGDKD